MIYAIIPVLLMWVTGRLTAAPEILVSALFGHRLGLGLGDGFGDGSLTRCRSGLFFHAQALGHDLLGVLGIDILGVLRHAAFAGRSLIGDELVGGEFLLAGELAAFDNGVGDLAGE